MQQIVSLVYCVTFGAVTSSELWVEVTGLEIRFGRLTLAGSEHGVHVGAAPDLTLRVRPTLVREHVKHAEHVIKQESLKHIHMHTVHAIT
jgi:hypothetical protein